MGRPQKSAKTKAQYRVKRGKTFETEGDEELAS